MKAEYPRVACALSPRVQGPLLDCFGVGTAVSGVAQAAGSVAAASEQAGATRDAAKTSADAYTHAADVQGQSATAALEFERQQAEYEAKQQEVDRRANYGQWAAHEGNVSTIGELLGLGGKTIPSYVPGVPAVFGAGAAAPSSSTPVPAGVQARRLVRAPVAGAPQVPTVADIVGAPPVSAPTPLSVRMGGNTGFVPPMATPQLQPDGTYRIPSAPGLAISDYLRT